MFRYFWMDVSCTEWKDKLNAFNWTKNKIIRHWEKPRTNANARVFSDCVCICELQIQNLRWTLHMVRYGRYWCCECSTEHAVLYWILCSCVIVIVIIIEYNVARPWTERSWKGDAIESGEYALCVANCHRLLAYKNTLVHMILGDLNMFV